MSKKTSASESVLGGEKAEKANEKSILAIVKKVTGDGKAIGSMVAALQTMTDKLRVSLTLTAACCIVHHVEHGNTTPANNMLKAVGHGPKAFIRTNALISFFERKGGMVFDKKAKQLVHDKAKHEDVKARYNDDELAFKTDLIRSPFTETNKQPDYQGFDLPKLVVSLAERALKAQTKHGTDERTNVTGIDDLVKLAKRMTKAA